MSMFSGNDPYLIISGTSNYDRCDVTQNQEKDNLSIHSAKSVLAKGYIHDHWVSARIRDLGDLGTVYISLRY